MLVEILQLAISQRPIILWVWLTGRLTRVIHCVRKRVGTERNKGCTLIMIVGGSLSKRGGGGVKKGGVCWQEGCKLHLQILSWMASHI